MAELMLCLLLMAVGGVVWSMRNNTNPAALWAWGWGILASTVLLTRFGGEITWAPPFVVLLSPTLPAFLLAGSIVYADRKSPAWLLPVALLVGALRWSLMLGQLPTASHLIGMIPEPAVELIAVYFVYTVARRPTATLAQRALVPALLAVTALDALTSTYVLRGVPLPQSVVSLWPWISIVTLAIQLTSTGHRNREQRRALLLEQEESRQALQESQERFAVLAEHATDLISETDQSGFITYISPSCEEILGWARDELIGTLARDLIHPEDQQRTFSELDRTVDMGATAHVQLRTRHRNGSWIRLDSSIRGFLGTAGEQRAVSIGRDVTESYERQQTLQRSHDTLEQRVHERTAQLSAAVDELKCEIEARSLAEHEVRTSRERYRAISEISSDFGFGFYVDANGGLEVEWITDAFERLTGYSIKELEESGWQKILSPEAAQAGHDSRREYLNGQTVEFESQVTTKSGRIRCFHTRMISTLNVSDGRHRVVGATRDITERRQAEEESRRLETRFNEMQRLESLGVLAGGIAHDFNNLLSVILGNASLALADLPEDSSASQRVARIRTAAQHAAALTDQMLTYSGKTPFSPKPLDLSRVVEDSVDLLEASVSRKNSFELALSSEPLPFEGDETQIRQVVVNLVTNAVEAIGDRGGVVRVGSGSVEIDSDLSIEAVGGATLPRGSYIYLDVDDSGPGMDQGTRERIFEPFFTTRRSGRGLGLAAVLGIATSHKGAIVLESEVGHGTKFRVLFPKSSPVAGITRLAGTTRSAEPSQSTVLVVDDDDAVLEISGELLKRAGFRVLTATSGREAIAQIENAEQEIDTVLLDLVMPDLDGEQTLREIRRIRPDMPVVLTSGYDQERTSERFAGEDLAGFLRKPCEPDEMIATVKSSLDH